jgi:hypothetical protein
MRRLLTCLAAAAGFVALLPASGQAAVLPGTHVPVDKGGSLNPAELRAFPGGGAFPRDHERKEHEGSERNVEKPAPRRDNSRSPRTADGGVIRTGEPTLSLASPLGFDGPSLNEAPAYPPDTQGDIGPSQFIAMVNGRVRSYSKTTGAPDGVLDADTDVFWASVMTPGSGNFTTDPHIRYDRLSGRWFAVMIDVPGGTGSQSNRIMLAVSDGGTITDSTNFHFFSIPEGVSGEFADYPTLGIDKNALYIGTNQFKTTGVQGFAGTNVYVVNKASLIAGTPSATRFRAVSSATGAGPFTPQGVDNDDPGATSGFFIGVDNATFGQLDLLTVSNPGGAPSVSTQTLTVPVTAFPLSSTAAGGVTIPGGTALDDLDDRLYAAQMQNGHIFTAHNIGVTASGAASASPTRDASRWYEINPGSTPTLVQSGTVFDNAASNPRSYWIPSVAVSKEGVMAIGGTVASAVHDPNAWYAARAPGESAGSVGGLTEYTSSSASYSPPFNRWGDYSLTRVDPDDGMTMWTIQEYVRSTDVWGTRVAKLRAPAPPQPTGSTGPAALGAASTTLTITGPPSNGVGYFDPGTGFPDRLSVAISGCGVTVNGVTQVSPGAISLDVNTTAAVSGAACNVVVTNPDGQSATANSLFTASGNHVPVANADGPFALTCCGPFNGTSVLANDSDADGSSLTAVKVSDPAHGALALAPDGTFTYTPAAGFAGDDSFSYAASDGAAQSAPAAVSLKVAPAPAGGGGTAATGQPPGTTPGSGTTNATPSGKAARLTLSLVLTKTKLRALIAKGLRLRASCSRSCRITVRLLISAKDAKRLHLKRTIATAKGRSASGLRLRLSRKAVRGLARSKSVRVTVAASALTSDGLRATRTKSVTIKR